MKVNKLFLYCLVLFLPCVVQSQSVEDEYLSNPVKLERALARCPNESPKGIDCAKLLDVEATVNRWISELRMDPQLFGLSIIDLQTTLAQEIEANQKRPSAALQQEIEQNQKTLTGRLSVISWLESPRKKY